MKLSDGVEQAIHSVTMLAGLSSEGVLSAAALAEFHGVSASYLLKHLQALSRAGVVKTLSGPNGGYRLGRSPSNISLLDIVLAVEGEAPAFRCNEIRRRGPNPLPGRLLTKPCSINAAMLRAEQAYRAELSQVSIADILSDVSAMDDGAIAQRSCTFLEVHERKPSSTD